MSTTDRRAAACAAALPASAYATITFNDDAGDSFVTILDDMVRGGYIVKLNGVDVRLVNPSQVNGPWPEQPVDSITVINVDEQTGIDLPDAAYRFVAYADIETIHVY